MKRTVATLVAILGVLAIGSTAARADGTFRASELNLSLYGSWVDKDDSKLAPGIGITYYLTKNWGVGATLDMENYDGTFIDNIAAEGYYRFQLGSDFAPYGLVGIGYSWEHEESFEYFGGGVEYRLDREMSVFGDIRYQINNDTDNGIGIRVGVRWIF